MADYQIVCPHCNYVNVAQPVAAGMTAPCGSCGQAVVVPVDILVEEINDRHASLWRIIKWSVFLSVIMAGFIALVPPLESTEQRVLAFFWFFGSGLFAFPSFAFSFKCLGRWLIVVFACGGEIAAVIVTMLVFPFAGPLCAIWFIYDLQRLKGRLREIAPELLEPSPVETRGSAPATTPAVVDRAEPPRAEPERPEAAPTTGEPALPPADLPPPSEVGGTDEVVAEMAPGAPPSVTPSLEPSVGVPGGIPAAQPSDTRPGRGSRAAAWVATIFFGAFILLCLLLAARQFASMRGTALVEPEPGAFEEPPLEHPEAPQPDVPPPPTPPQVAEPRRIVLEGEEFEGLSASNRDGWKIDDASGGTGGLSLATCCREAEAHKTFAVEAGGDYEVLVAIASTGSTELIRIDGEQFVVHSGPMAGASWRSVPWTNLLAGRVRLDSGQHTVRLWHVAGHVPAGPATPDSIHAFGLVDNVQLVPTTGTSQ